MGLLSNIFTGGASSVIDSVGNVLDKVVTTKGEKMQLDLEMKTAEYQFQTDMKKLTNDQQQQIFQDVNSARVMAAQVQTSANATWLAKNVSPLLAIGTTVLAFVLFYFVVFKNKALIDNNSKDVVIYILGVLSAIVTQIFSFYFGSSQGSQDKNKIIENMHDKSVPMQAK